jgi:hypothetical protein
LSIATRRVGPSGLTRADPGQAGVTYRPAMATR